MPGPGRDFGAYKVVIDGLPFFGDKGAVSLYKASDGSGWDAKFRFRDDQAVAL
jgi:hypothetical protein